MDTLEQQVNARIEAAMTVVNWRKTMGSVPTEAELEHGKRLMDNRAPRSQKWKKPKDFSLSNACNAPARRSGSIFP